MSRDELRFALNEALHNDDDPHSAYEMLFDAVKEHLGYDGQFKVVADPHPDNPRNHNVDLITSLVLKHKRYDLGDNDPDPNTLDDVVFKRTIYGYDHGGITFSATPYADKFDSGVLGVQYITRGNLVALGLAGLGTDHFPTDERLEEWADHELHEYRKYIEGGNAWVVQVLGDDDDHCVTAESWDEFYRSFDHEILHRGDDSARARTTDELFNAWENRRG